MQALVIGYSKPFRGKSYLIRLVQNFTQAIFVAATRCIFCRAEVATSCDLIAILVQFVRANIYFLNKSCMPAKK